LSPRLISQARGGVRGLRAFAIRKREAGEASDGGSSRRPNWDVTGLKRADEQPNLYLNGVR
jgi:hypothetical protein